MPSLSSLMRQREMLAACQFEDEEVFLTDRNTKKDIEQFKSICDSCPVLDICRDISLVYDTYTNLAGTTKSEREKYRETGAYLNLLIRAETEGWLVPELAIGSVSDISYAVQKANRNKPAFTDFTYEVEEISLQSYVSPF